MKKIAVTLLITILFSLFLGACTTPEVVEETPEADSATEEVVSEETEVAATEESEPVLDFDANIAADSEYEIAVVLKNFNNAFWLQHVDGAEAAGEDLGVTVTTYAPEKPSNIEEQISIIEDIITKGTDCMVLAPANTESIAVAVAALNEAGIPVVYDNTIGSGGDYLAYAGIDNVAVGRQLGYYIAELMDGEGKLLMLEGIPGQSTSDLRVQGVKEALAEYPNIEVEYQPAHWELSEASDITTAVLQKWPDLKAIIAAGSNMSEGAAEAAKSAGIDMDDIIIGSFDVTDQTVEAIQNGSIDFTIDQQPYLQAYFSVAACIQYLNGLEVPSEIQTPVAFVTIENLSEHLME